MSKDILPYKNYLKNYSRKLRNNSTLSEVLLWNKLKRKQIKGYQFLRQKPIDNFIVDFYCKKLKLAIEIDGSSHIGKEEADFERQKIIENYGIKFIRFSDIDVKKNMSGVLEKLILCIEDIENGQMNN